jgi:HK97 family phage portal protein
MDILKGIRSLGMRKKELGIPAPAWVFSNNGLWVYASDEYATYVNNAYKKIPWVYSIISHIIDKASDAPILVLKEKRGQSTRKFDKALRAGLGLHDMRLKALKEKVYDEVDHPLIEVFENPNPLDTEKTLKEQFLGYLLITGNAFMYAGTPGKASVNATKPTELWCLPSPAVKIIPGSSKEPVAGYIIEGTTKRYDPWQIAHCKYFNPSTQYEQSKMLYGLSPLVAARGVINQADASDFAQGMLYKNMGPRGILAGDKDNNLTDEQAVQIRDRFKQNYMGLENAGEIIVTSANLRWQEIGLSPVDLNLIEADKNYLEKLAAIYRYPKEIITGSENVASQGVSDKQVITKCVLPALRRFDDCMTKWARLLYNDPTIRVISDTGYFPELEADREKQSKWLAQAWWITPNEKRTMMDYDDLPDENMDKVLVPGGVKTLEDIADPIEIDDETAFQDFDQSPGDSGDTDNS